jgi:hypothetical protein
MPGKPDIIDEGLINEERTLESIRQSLHSIQQGIKEEILAKQITIQRQEQEIKQLHSLLKEKDKIILEKGDKLIECMRTTEGNKQLVNKLLGDINRLHQDIEWYKRTYEKRSLLGAIKEKVLKKRNK